MQVLLKPKFTPALPLAAACLLLAFTGCERKTVVVVDAPPGNAVARTDTLETRALKSAIDAYQQAPTNERAADVRKAFAELDSEIAELEGHVARKEGNERAEAAQKLANLVAYRAAESDRFAKSQAGTRPTVPIPVDGRPAGEKIEDAARRTGETVKDAAKEVGNAIKDAVR
jgi:hypothetical protein